MKVYNSDNHALMIRHFSLQKKHYLAISVQFYYDLIEDRVLTNQHLWNDTPYFLREDQLFDEGYPKVKAEVIVYGNCYAKKPVQARSVGFRVGDIHKELQVVGDRVLTIDSLGVEYIGVPKPFTKVKVGFENAFGGIGYEHNPIGKGYIKERQRNKPYTMPNIMHNNESTTAQSFEPLNEYWSHRKQYHGTYDKTWFHEQWPHHANDTNMLLFNTALPDQQQSEYFRGDESVKVVHMHPELERIEGRLPAKRIRIFLTKVNTKGDEEFFEAETKLDTVVIFSDIARAALMYRATVEVSDEDYGELKRAYIGMEDLGAPKKELHYYQELQELALEREKVPEPPDLSKSQQELSTAMKEVGDIPMKLEMALKEVKGESKVVQAYSPKLNAIALEKFKGTEHEAAFKELANIDSDFIKAFEEVEKKFENYFKDHEKDYPPKVFKDMKEAFESEKKPSEIIKARKNTWQEGALEFVGECKYELPLHPSCAEHYKRCGIREAMCEVANLGYNPERKTIPALEWSNEKPIELPKGFVIPFFQKDELKKVVIRPAIWDEDETFIGSENDIVIDGSSDCDMVFSGKCKDMIAITDDPLKTALLHQELWNVCGVGSFKSEKELLESEFYSEHQEGIKHIVAFESKITEDTKRTFKIVFERSLIKDYLSERDIQSECVELLPDSACKKEMQKEMRKKKRLGRKYQPKVNPNLKKEFGDAINKSIDDEFAKGEAVAKKMIDDAKKQVEGIKGSDKFFQDLDKPLKESPADMKQGMLEGISQARKYAKEEKAIKALDEMESFVKSPELQNILNIESEIDAAMSPVKALEQNGAIPDWAKKSFEKAFGQPMDFKRLEFETREAVEEHYAKGLSFKEASLKGLELDGIDLSNADFEKADLSGVTLNGAQLQKANFSNAVFQGAELNYANFSETLCLKADFSTAELQQVNFSKANISRAKFGNCKILKADFRQTDATQVLFDDAFLIECNFSEAVCDNTRCQATIFSKCTFLNTQAEHIGLRDSIVLESDFSNANLDGANYFNTTVSECIFEGASMKDAVVMVKSAFDESSFIKADVTGMNFDGVIVNRCDMYSALMNECIIRNSAFNEVVLKRSKLKYANLDYSAFLGCDLSKANMMFVSLRKTNINGCNLSDANLFSADIYKATLKDVNFDGCNLDLSSLARDRHSFFSNDSKENSRFLT